jgi:hypothetical protein
MSKFGTGHRAIHLSHFIQGSCSGHQQTGRGPHRFGTPDGRREHLRSPELAKLLSSAFENHQAVMLQTPWPEPMLQAFESTRRFLEGAAQADLPGTQAPAQTPDA